MNHSISLELASDARVGCKAATDDLHRNLDLLAAMLLFERAIILSA